MTGDNEVIDEMNARTEAEEPVNAKIVSANKPEAEKIVHAQRKAQVDARPLESVFLVGSTMEIAGIEMECVKRNGMTVTFRRKDIVG